MKNIKNIIFDLGGVLINLDSSKTEECFGEKITTFFDKKINSTFFDILCKYERGEIKSKVFREEVSKIFGFNLSKKCFNKCWNAMIRDMPTNRILMLLKLREKYNIFLLSNTNTIHYNYFTKQDYWESKIFKKLYFSHEVGMRKPEPEIFKLVLNENKLKPEETLFLDDTKANIEAAQKLGINSVLIDRETETIINELI